MLALSVRVQIVRKIDESESDFCYSSYFVNRVRICS